MRIWFDTEFIEDGNSVDFISIGLIDETNKTYYAINNEVNLSRASLWVRENVLTSLPEFTNPLWKSKNKIKNEIIEFIGSHKPEFWVYNGAYDWVILCQIFGGMRHLPKHYPWYSNDIKQLWRTIGSPQLPPNNSNAKHHALEDAKWTKKIWELLNNKYQ